MSSSDFKLSPVTAAIVVHIYTTNEVIYGACGSNLIVSIYSLQCTDVSAQLWNFLSEIDILRCICWKEPALLCHISFTAKKCIGLAAGNTSLQSSPGPEVVFDFFRPAPRGPKCILPPTGLSMNDRRRKQNMITNNTSLLRLGGIPKFIIIVKIKEKP